MKYKKVAVGGTFDRLHNGHKELLNTAFSISNIVVVGITTEKLTKHKRLSHIVEPYNERKKHIEDYLIKNNLLKRTDIAPLSDRYGSTLSDDLIQAVVVGPRVSKKAVEVIRKKKDIVQCKTIYSKDGSYLSSSRIRLGEITRSGNVYILPENTLMLPHTLRGTLRMPLGEYVNDRQLERVNSSNLLISIGDASFIKLITQEIYPDIIILDGMINKKHVLTENHIRKLAGKRYLFKRTENIAGSISQVLIQTTKSSIKKALENNQRNIIFIRGEDDLAVLPSVFYAPLESVVIYGQPAFLDRRIKPGMIYVSVTEQKKDEVSNLINQFRKR